MLEAKRACFINVAHNANVMGAWDNIAQEWDRVRRKPVKTAEILANKWMPGKILDIGCGNGRNLLPFLNRGFDCFGIDSSKELIKLAKERITGAKLIVANAAKLPFPDKSFDYAICLAVLHHLKPAQHKKAVSEIHRVLKPGGKAAIAVWNKLQPRFIFGKKERTVPWKTTSGKVFGRYYYFFTFWELKSLLKKHGFAIKEGKGRFGKNIEFICARSRKG